MKSKVNKRRTMITNADEVEEMSQSQSESEEEHKHASKCGTSNL